MNFDLALLLASGACQLEDEVGDEVGQFCANFVRFNFVVTLFLC